MANATISFSRTPRRYFLPPDETVTVQPPPRAQAAPAMSVVALLLPGLGMALSVGLMAAFMRDSSPAYLLFSLPMMFISVGVGAYSYWASRRKHRRETAARTARYRAYLSQTDTHLADLQQRQAAAEAATHPAPPEWLERATERAASIWERAPQDADFLELRLGRRTGQNSFRVEAPPPPPAGDEPDPLYLEASQLASRYAAGTKTLARLDLRALGMVAAGGARARVLSACRAWLIEAAGACAPDDLRFMVLYPPGERSEWAWTRWLPHTLTAGGRALAETPDKARRLLGDLAERLRTGDSALAGDHTLIVVADLKLVDWPLLRTLRAAESPAVTCLFVLDSLAQAPKDCRALVEIAGAAGARLKLVGPPPVEMVFEPEGAETEAAESLARALAPLRAEGAERSDTGLPERAALFPWLNWSTEAIAERWRAARPWETLAAPIGLLPGQALLEFDLHESAHGPHGLMAGTTGSGKSELLQTILVSLAASFSPYDMAFLIVDFKGGALARSVSALPHVLGVISNLDGAETTRALVSLRAELQRRQRLLAKAQVDHIDKYQRRRRQEPEGWPPMPHLLILVDEFAEFAKAQPEVLADLVSTARVGRSLGCSLVLATQRPAGIISDQIAGNSRFRICLRVEAPGDSHEVLRRPDAAGLSRRTPGRGFFQIGTDEVFWPFQALYGGAPYSPQRDADEQAAIYAVDEMGARRRLYPPPTPRGDDPTQMDTLVRRVTEAAAAERLAPLSPLWLPPLPEQLALDQLPPAASPLVPVLGLVDDPERQRQFPLTVDLDQHGHVLIIGGPRTGKSTLLMTLALAVSRAAPAGEVHLYLVDCGNRQLKLLEGLPQVGAVITSDETDRLQRLWYWLDQEFDRRRQLLGAAGVANLTAYRQMQPGAPPAILLVIDNYADLVAQGPEVVNMLARLIRDGSSLGVHVAIAATGANAVPFRLVGNLSFILSLELPDRADYLTLVGRTELVPVRGVRGRGLMKGDPVLEFQAALPVAGTDTERGERLKEQVAALQQAYQGPAPRRIRERPSAVLLEELTPVPGGDGSRRLPVGLDPQTLDPVYLDLAQATQLVVTGAAGAGKSSLLRMLLLAVAAGRGPDQARFYLVSQGAPTLAVLADLPHVAEYVSPSDPVSKILPQLTAEVEARRLAGAEAAVRQPVLIVTIDDYDPAGFKSDSAKWLTLLEQGPAVGVYVWVAGSATKLQNILDPVAKAIRGNETGFVLASTDGNDLGLFNVRLSLAEQSRRPGRGHGFLIVGGQYQAVQLATAGDPQSWDRFICRQTAAKTEANDG